MKTKRIDYKTYEELVIACREFVKQGIWVSQTQDPKKKEYWVEIKDED